MIETIFPTLLYVHIPQEQQLKQIQSEIANTIDKINSEYNEDWGKTHKVSPLADNIIAKHSLVGFEQFIKQNLDSYLNQLNYKGSREYRIESWVSLFNTDDYGHIHDHGNADISGVYYFQTNTQDGDIVFYNPTVQVDMSTCFKSNNWKHSPTVGKLLLFPGYLKHGIERNQTTSTRISISFNLFFNKYQ